MMMLLLIICLCAFVWCVTDIVLDLLEKDEEQ